MKQPALVLATALITSCASGRGGNLVESAKPEAHVRQGRQAFCPVMTGRAVNDRLYVDYGGFRIYVCCVPCAKTVRKNPEKYLRKLESEEIAVEKVKQGDTTEGNSEDPGKQNDKQNDR